MIQKGYKSSNTAFYTKKGTRTKKLFWCDVAHVFLIDPIAWGKNTDSIVLSSTQPKKQSIFSKLMVNYVCMWVAIFELCEAF